MVNGESRRKLAIHGPVVELESHVPALEESLDALLGTFSVPGWPEHFTPITGSLHPYDESKVLPRLPETARHITRTADAIDVFEDSDRYWMIDDRWGMCEIDIARNQWQSWTIPAPKLDAYRIVELSVMGPMAQLLRMRGLHLLPAISAVRDGFAVLILCPFGIEPELATLIANGYKIIGQRWTGVREEDGRLALLHIPGRIERLTTPRLRIGFEEQESWIDLSRQYPGSSQNHAFCDAVLVAEAGRRHKAHLRQTHFGDATTLLKDIWPMAELHPARRINAMPAKLAEHCQVFEVQLSRNSKDLLALLNSIRYASAFGDEQSVAA